MGNQLWPIFKSHFSKAHRENRHIEKATAQVSGFTNAAVYEENDEYNRETTVAIKTFVEATEMERIHVANLAADNTNLTRTTTTITTEMATIKNLMRKIQSQINQLALNGPQGSLHTVTHNRSPGNNTPDKNESYCWPHGQTRNNEHTSVTCRNKKTGHISKVTLHNRGGGRDKWITKRINV